MNPGPNSFPHVRIRLAPKHDFSDGSFCPLTLPTKIDTLFLEPQKAAGAVSRLVAHATCRFLPGDYEFALNRENPLLVRIPEDFQADVHIACTRMPPFATPVVTSLELEFSRPLQLERVLPTLFVLPRVFDDRDVAFLREAARQMGLNDIRNSFSRFAENLSAHLRELGDTEGPDPLEAIRKTGRRFGEFAGKLGDFLGKSGENLPHVFLRRVDTIFHIRSGRAELDLAFTGEIGWPNAPVRRFERVVLPQTIIPSLHGELGRLMGPQPASSATLRLETVDPLDLARPAARMIERLEGAWKIELSDMRMHVETEWHDHSRVQMEAVLAPMTVAGGIRGEVQDGTFSCTMPNLEIRQEDRQFSCDIALSVTSRDPGVHPCEAAVLQAFGREAAAGYEFHARLHPGSALGNVDVLAHYLHPYVKGGLRCPLRLEDVRAGLELAMRADDAAGPWEPMQLKAEASADFSIPAAAEIDDGRTRVEPRNARGRLTAGVERTSDGGYRTNLNLKAGFALGVRQEIDPIPELGLVEEAIHAHLEGELESDVHLHVTDADPVTATLDGSRLHLDLSKLELASAGYAFTFPRGIDLRAEARTMHIDTTGTGRTRADLAWDLRGKSPVLTGNGRREEVFVPELRQGTVHLDVDPLGHLEIGGLPGGLYDAHFWNALVNPGSEPRRWLDILLSDSAMERVAGALAVFHEKAARALTSLRRVALRARDILEEMGVKKPGDFLPAERMAEFAARLTDRPKEASVWHEIILEAVAGRGVDLTRVRRLLEDALPEHEHHFELDRMLRITSLLVTPTEPVYPRVEREILPLARQPRHAELLRRFPSAADVDALPNNPDSGRLEALARLAHYLTFEQLQYLLKIPEEKWDKNHLARIKIIMQLKERLALFGEHYGGIGYLLQPWAISFFLGQAAVADMPHQKMPLRFETGACGPWELPEDTFIQGLLGPHDIAVLLQGTLASPLPTRTVQVNRRMLLGLLERAPAAAVRQVLCALAGNSPRILAHVLYGLFNQPQDLLRHPVDTVDLVERACSIPMPRQAQFLAHGKRAMDSYYQALWEAASSLLASFDAENALFAHLRESRREAPVVTLSRTWRERVHAALDEADAVSAAFTPDARGKRHRPRALAAHEKAVETCREWLAHEPGAFADPRLRAYMARHFEALQVLSIVRNYQEDIDRVRPWLHHRSSRDRFRSEADLLETVVDVLYHEPEDARAVWEDPLVRLMWDPPEARLDFAVVSCMGVITEGAHGTELTETFERLEKRRGVQVVRADTQTSRSLEFNADRVIEAVRTLRGPYGLLGYSQGCANALCAEARMLAGPPPLQELARGLRGRQFLFSAINGSAHGTCGDWKLHRTMVELDRFMKHYQGIFSGTLIRFTLQNLNALLDSREFLQGFGGMASLSYEGVEALAREGQFSPSAPTCILRGIVDPETLPEALELLSNALAAQLQDERHDTQVQVDEAVGHFRYVRNPWTDVLRGCDIGCRIQATHHWSPLLAETDFITTRRDRERCIYDVPKDRHVFPWVDLLHRFGLVRERA